MHIMEHFRGFSIWSHDALGIEVWTCTGVHLGTGKDAWCKLRALASHFSLYLAVILTESHWKSGMESHNTCWRDESGNTWYTCHIIGYTWYMCHINRLYTVMFASSFLMCCQTGSGIDVSNRIGCLSIVIQRWVLKKILSFFYNLLGIFGDITHVAGQHLCREIFIWTTSSTFNSLINTLEYICTFFFIILLHLFLWLSPIP